MKKIVIYGGAFSPPHLGHASVIEAVLRLFPCDEVRVMPSADRFDKKVSASGEHRVEMLRIMINELFPEYILPILPSSQNRGSSIFQSNHKNDSKKIGTVIISDFELKLNKPTVTYETLKALKEKYPNYNFHFVLGSENIDMIETKWVNGKELFREANFIAIKNPLASMPQKLPPNLVVLDDVAWTNLSSTFIRKLLAQGYSGLPYLSKSVAEYIKERSLYK